MVGEGVRCDCQMVDLDGAPLPIVLIKFSVFSPNCYSQETLQEGQLVNWYKTLYNVNVFLALKHGILMRGTLETA